MASPIRFDGLLSGINYSGIVQQLLDVERRPITKLQTQIGQTKLEKTAYLELSASLLSLKTSADALARSSFFALTKVKSSSESVLLASGGQVGSLGAFTFTSSRLATSHQSVSNGYAAESSLVRPTSQGSKVSIEIGNGFVDRATRLTGLNGGSGVDRGKIRITDRLGGSAIVDLTDAVSVQNVLDRINGQTAANVTARVSGDRIVLDDRNSTAAAGSLLVENLAGDTTATDLGIEGTRSAAAGAALSLFGSAVQRISGATSLAELNDGLGVRRNGGADFTVTRIDGTSFSVDLGDADKTLQHVIDKINSAGGGTVVAAINSGGNGLTLADSTAGAGNLTVTSSGASNAAFDLGLLVAAELRGDTAAASGRGLIHGARLIAGLESVLRRTLNGGSAEYEADGGPFVGDFSGVRDGSVLFQDRTGASRTVSLATRSYRTLDAAAGAGSTVLDLASLDGVAVGNSIRLVNSTTGASEVRTVKGIVSVVAGTIELDAATTVALTAGSFAIAQNDSVGDIQNQFRFDPVVKADLRFNAQGNGFQVVDLSGGSAAALKVLNTGGGFAATDLGIETRFAGAATSFSGNTFTDAALIGLPDDYFNGATATLAPGGTRTVTDFDGVTGTVTVDGAALAAAPAYTLEGINATSLSGRDVDAQYIGEQTLLASLRQGKGVFQGSFRVIDTDGAAFNVDLSQSTDTTILAAIRDLNGAALAAGSGVRAKINDTGDGLLLVDTSPGTGTLRVEDLNGGTTARDLGIAGSAAVATPTRIDGSNEREFAVGATTTLRQLADAINSAGLGVSASIIRDGSGANPYRLSLLSTESGEAGRLAVQGDIRALSFSTAARGQDAVLLYGVEGPGSDPVLLTSSNNTFKNVVPGLTLDLVSASAGPVTVTVSRDTQGITDQAKRLVDGYNLVFDKVRELTKFNATTNKFGLLFGDSTLQGIDRSLKSLLTSPVSGILSADLNTLSEVGIRVAAGGNVTFDSARFNGLVETKFDQVKELFARQRPLEAITALKDLNDGRGVSQESGADFKIFTRSGSSFDVDLAGATDVQGVLSAINFAPGNAGKVVASIATDRKRLELVDSTVSSGSDFKVQPVGSARTAAELGIQTNVGSAESVIRGFEALLLGDPGAAARLAERLQAFTDDPDGVIATRTDGFDTRIADYEKRIEGFEERLVKLEERLTRQFSALETLLGQLQGTQSILTNQLQKTVDAFRPRTK